MITIFNRKELFITYSMEEQAKIRTLLSEKGIDYDIKTVNRKSSSPLSPGSRARTATFGENADVMYEYIFYVNKADFEKAEYVLRNRS